MLVTIVFAAACARGGQPGGGPPLAPVPQVLLVEVSGIAEARSWAVRTEQEWRALWEGFPATEVRGRTLPAVDFPRDMVVVVTAGNGSSGGPALSFDGYLARGDTTEVHVRSRVCAPADDRIQLLVAGRVPRRAGPVRVIRHNVAGCDD
jgi:hypothetical protein